MTEERRQYILQLVQRFGTDKWFCAQEIRITRAELKELEAAGYLDSSRPTSAAMYFKRTKKEVSRG
jgi:hypothetical protein